MMVQRQVQHEYVDAWLAQEPQLAAFRMFAHCCHHRVHRDVPDLGDLVSRLRATDEHGLPLVQALEDLASGAEQRAANRLLERGEKGALKALLPLGLLMVPVSIVVSVVPSILIMLGRAGP